MAAHPGPGPSEQLILDQHLRRLVKYSGLSSFQRFLQQVCRNPRTTYARRRLRPSLLICFSTPATLSSPP